MKKHSKLQPILLALFLLSLPFGFNNPTTFEGFFFNGLWHNCVGSATTNINSSGPEPILEVSNIGDTGDDGLDMWINFTKGFGYHAYLPDPNTLPHGAFVKWKYLQEGTAGFTESLVEKQEVQNNTGPPRVQFSYDASGIGASALKVEVYNNNTELVYENTVENNTPAYAISPPELGDIIGFDAYTTNKDHNSSISNDDEIVFVPPTGPEMTLAAGSVIFVSPTGGTPTNDPTTKIEMRTAQTNHYKVSVERIAMFEDETFFHALGSTRPVGAEQGNLLQLRDMDGGGDDGIRVDLMEKILAKREKVFEFEDYHIANINTNSDDAWMQLKTLGKLSLGGNEQEIGSVSIQQISGDAKMISADFTAVGEERPVYQIFKDGILVVESDEVNTLLVQDWVEINDFKTRQPGLTKYSNIYRFPKDQNIVLNGNGYIGDELRISAEVGENIWLTKLDLLTDGIESLDILDASVFLEEEEEETKELAPFLKIVGDSLPNHYNTTKKIGNFIFAVGYTGMANSANNRGIISKFDLSGNLLWTTQLNRPSSFNDLVETDNSFSDFIVVGRSEPVRIGSLWQNNESIICSIDTNGNLNWSNHYDQNNRENMVKVVRPQNPVDPNYPIYIAGVENPSASSAPSTFDYVNVFNINNAGLVKWKNQYVIDNDNEFIRDFLPLSNNGDLALIGNHEGLRGTMITIDGNGAVKLNKTFHVNPNHYFRGAVEINGTDEYYIIGEEANNHAIIARMDIQGNELWSYKMGAQIRFTKIDKAPNGDLYVVGQGLVAGKVRFLVNKFTSDGQYQWTKYIDEKESAYLPADLDVLPGGNLLYSDGREDHPNGFGDYDALLSVFDLEMNSDCTEEFTDTVIDSLFLNGSRVNVTVQNLIVNSTQKSKGLSLELSCAEACAVNTPVKPFIKVVGDSLPNHYNRIKKVGNHLYAAGYSGTVNSNDTRAIFSKYDLTGNLLWTAQLTTPTNFLDFVETNDNGDAFLCVGRTEPIGSNNNWRDNRSILCKIDQNGNIVQLNYFQQAGREGMLNIVRHPNPVDRANPFYISGIENVSTTAPVSTPSSSDYVTVFNVNENAAVNWKYQYASTGDNEFITTLTPLGSGDLALFGKTDSRLGYGLRIGGNGSIIDDFEIQDENSPNTLLDIRDAIEVPNSTDFFTVGYVNSNRTAFIARIDDHGNEIWSYKMGTQTRFDQIQLGPDGNLYVIGYGDTDGSGIARYLVNQFNTSGQLQWSRYIYDGENEYLGGELDLLPEGYIAYSDCRKDHPNGFGDFDVLIGVFDLDLSSLCTFDFQETVIDSAFLLRSDVRTTRDESPFTTTPSMEGGFLTLECNNGCGEIAPPCGINCGDDIFVPNDPGLCSAEVILPMPTFTGDCTDWTLISAPLFTTFPVGCTTASWVYVNNTTGIQQTCSIQVCVEDVEAPKAICNDFTVDVGNGPVTITPQDIGSAIENCPIVLETIDINTFDCSMVGTTVQVVYTAYDAADNPSQCTSNINVVDLQAPTITCPPDRDLDCSTDLSDPNNTGGYPTIKDVCDQNLTASFTDILVSGDECNGRIERTWMVTDASGNTNDCVQTLIITDTTPPEVSNCPTDVSITIQLDPMETTCQWSTQLPVPDVMDVCNDYFLNFTLTGATENSGTFTSNPIIFKEGVTQVVLTAFDDCGNASPDVCTYSVTVNCSVEFCPGNLVQNGDFEIGNPTGDDEDINLAANWGPIWDTGGDIFSTGDFYTTAQASVSPPTQGQVAVFWCSFSGSTLKQREGIMNQLSAPLQHGNDPFELSFLIACPDQDTYFGSPRLTAYAVNSGFSTAGISTFNTPTNLNMFPGGTVIELGSYDIPVSCDQTFTPAVINFNSTILTPGINFTHIFFTRADAISGGVLVAIDDVCLSKVSTPSCTCEDPILPAESAPLINVIHTTGCINSLVPAFSLEEECDEVTWKYRAPNSLGYTTIGTSQGNDPISYDFQAVGAGVYEICIEVRRTLADGTECAVETRCRKVRIKCGLPTLSCMMPLIDNPGFSNGAVAGILGNGGASEGWKASFGSPTIMDGAGCIDEYAVELSGNQSEADGLSTRVAWDSAGQYSLSMCRTLTVSGELHENTWLSVRISDEEQSGVDCVGNCREVARIRITGDEMEAQLDIPIEIKSGEEAYTYLTFDLQNESTQGDLKSTIILDGICIEPFDYLVVDAKDVFSAGKYNLYPNPSSGNLMVDFSEPTSSRLDYRIYDLWGRLLQSGVVGQGSSYYQLNLEAFTQGVYIFEIGNTAQGFNRKRIIKSND
ncbi:MAG: hypothetical protein Sapg2KO_40500 [Saprospiraceae bacterium]